MKKRHLLWFTLFFILSACTADMVDSSPPQETTSARNGFISMNQARTRLVALISEINSQIPNEINKFPNLQSTDSKKINGIAYDAQMRPLTRGDEATDANIYVFRMDNDMFAIMSATSDKPELLAFGTGTPNFEDPDASLPNPSYWNPIAPIDTNPHIAIPDTGKNKDRIIVKRRLTPTYIIHQNGGLCKVKWGNLSPYNDSLDLINVNGRLVRPATGCVAIGVAQLMTVDKLKGAFYKNHVFDWDMLSSCRDNNNFKDNPEATIEVATLFKDLTNEENINPSDWGEYTTWAYWDNIHRTLDNFNFSNSGTPFHRYDFDEVKAELFDGYPVLFNAYGRDAADTTRGGHLWICHGLLEVKTPVLVYSVSKFADQEDILLDQYEETAWYLQMNWGWDSDSDGYYLTRYDDYLDNVKGPDIPEMGTSSTAGYNVYFPNTITISTGIRF